MNRHDSPIALRINVCPEARELLVNLLDTGLFGERIEDVADQLIRERLRELRLQGWFGLRHARELRR
jgi:hypothetical protein